MPSLAQELLVLAIVLTAAGYLLDRLLGISERLGFRSRQKDAPVVIGPRLRSGLKSRRGLGARSASAPRPGIIPPEKTRDPR